MTEYKVYYAGYELTEYMTATVGLNRGILPESEHRLIKIGNSDGNRLLGSSYGVRKISMPFALKSDLLEKRRELARILNTKEEQPLIFSDEPDKVWFAIPQGDIGVDEQQFLGKGTIEWVVPDGVSYAVDSKFFTNIVDGSTGKNLVLDPEFIKKNKYWKPWSQLLNEQHGGGSNVLRGNFTDPTTADNSPIKNDHWFQQNAVTTRNMPNIKVGDAFSLAIDVRIVTPTTGDTTGAKSAALIFEEWDRIGGTILERQIVRPTTLKVGAWQKLTLTNIKIKNERTKAINLAVGVYSDATVDISKPQLNVGSELLPYTASDVELNGTVDIINDGTYKTYPIIRARMNGENGLVAFVKNNGGILQFGNPEELDVVQGVKSDKVIDYSFRGGQSELNVNNGGVSTYPNYLSDPTKPNLVTGKIDWVYDPEAATPYFANGDVKVWGGPRLWGDIPKNSANENTGDFNYTNRFIFNSNVKKQGRLEFVLQNEQEVAIAMVIRDSSATKDEVIVECWFGNKNLKSMSLNRDVFRFEYWEMQITRTGTKIEYKISNIFNNDLRSTADKSYGTEKVKTRAVGDFTITPTPDGFYGNVTSKPDSQHFAKYDQTFVVDMTDNANLPITGLTTWFQRFGNTNHVLMHWQDCKFTWVNTPTYRNIPNLFNDGDLVEIDVRQREVAVNGVINNQLHALGNNWEMFTSELGEETIQPIASSWANMYEVEVELREAFL